MRVVTLLVAVSIFAALALGDACSPTVGPNDRTYSDSAYQQATNTCNLAGSGCTPAGFAAAMTINTQQQYKLDKYLQCVADPSGTSCCADQCYVTRSTMCLSNPNCILVPGAGTSMQCITKNKLCGMLTTTNASQCDFYSFCTQTGGVCLYAPPKGPAAAPPAESVEDKCPAMHPLVIAMLALMFISFVGAVVVVAVVVYRNQKKADEEDSRREQADAAAAEAKRARANRNRL